MAAILIDTKAIQPTFEAIDNALLIDCSQVSVDDLKGKDYNRFSVVVFHRFKFADCLMQLHVRKLLKEFNIY